MGGALFHDDGGGTGDEGVEAVWGVGEIRRWCGKSKESVAGAGKVDDLQAAEWGVQLECDGAAAEEICSGDGGFFCGAADSD